MSGASDHSPSWHRYQIPTFRNGMNATAVIEPGLTARHGWDLLFTSWGYGLRGSLDHGDERH